MDLPDEPTEADTNRDGFLSYAAEWHALTHGVYRGLSSRKIWDDDPPENPDVDKEPHYYAGGYVLGTGLQVVFVLVLAWLGMGVV